MDAPLDRLARPQIAASPLVIGSGRTQVSIQSLFPSTEAMEQVLALGAEEGLRQAVGQIDAILAEDAESSTTRR
jgi:hypothetical protein